MDVCSGKARVVILLLGEALALFLSEVERDALVDTINHRWCSVLL